MPDTKIEMKYELNGDITVNCVKALDICDWDTYPDAQKLQLIEGIAHVLGSTLEKIKESILRQAGMIV